MTPIDFNDLSKRSEKAVSLTRYARGTDSENAKKIGETAAQVLHGVVRELAKSRRYVG